jgi:hypothetical protein
MTRETVSVFVSCLVSLSAQVARAYTTPTFDTVPAIVAGAVADESQTPEEATVIFAGNGGALMVLARQNNNTQWEETFADGFTPPGGFVGNPAAVYTSSPVRGGQILVCMHSKQSPGYMFCGGSRVEYNGPGASPPFYIQFADDGQTQIGSGTFPPTASPSLIRYQQAGNWIDNIFARGMDNQIWAAYRVNSGAWNGWFQLPTLPGGFDQDPAVTALGGGRVMVCGMPATGNIRYACNPQIVDSSGNVVWSNWSTAWDTGNRYTSLIGRPALATTSNATFLFATAPNGVETVVFTTDSGGSWSAPATVGNGSGFFSGPAAFGSANGLLVLSAALGSDRAIWYNTGSTTGFSTGWVQLNQVHYP